MTTGNQLGDKGVARNLRVWLEIRDLEQLQELTLIDVAIGNTEAMDAFWEICDRHQLKKLVVQRVDFSGPSNHASLPMLPVLLPEQLMAQGTHRPRRGLQELKLFNVKCDESARMQLIDILTQSEDLRRITNHSSDDVFGIACQSVTQHPTTCLSSTLSKTQRRRSVSWSQLVSVNIHHRNCNADTILKSCSSKLEEFEISEGELGIWAISC